MTPAPCVFFDLDGTLIDTTYLHTVAWSRALEDFRIRIPMYEVHPLIGMDGDRMLEELLGEKNEDVSQAHGAYFSEMHSRIRALPGANAMLQKVDAQGARSVLVSSAKEEDLPVLFGPLEDKLFADVIHSAIPDKSKPDPDPFLVAVERAKIEPSRGIAVGDSIWDVKASNSAGLACVGLESGGTDRRLLSAAGAVEVYKDLQEVIDNWEDTPFPQYLTVR
jgi:HAD superfamily hydrolase (TIGR01509 family)